ncbi:molybdopterin dinucleotide binding domain-containing protein, partial [Thermodesulfobacteriota bacterium]
VYASRATYGTIETGNSRDDLVTGYGPGRADYGEQFHRAASTLAILTGNVGNSGGNPAGFDRVVGMPWHQPPCIPAGKNPLESKFPSVRGSMDTALRNRSRVHWAKMWDAILEGKSGGYPADFKLAYISSGNPLNQMPNVNKGIRALNKLETVILHDQFMTSTAKFADIVLPSNSQWARDDVRRPWYVGTHYICANKAIESLPETKPNFEIACELAPRLGIHDFSDKDEEGWRRELVATLPDMAMHITDYEKFKREGVWRLELKEPVISLKPYVEDPENNPLPTPSGKIEIYSQQLAELNDPELPPIPKYITSEEGPSSAYAQKYPLQLITNHCRTRAHSIFGNTSWLNDLEPQALWISCKDAQNRGITDGQMITVFNERGRAAVPAKVTERILPGVVALGQGAWYTPDEKGVDHGGCPNVLTKDEYSPGGAFISSSVLVQVERS